MFGLDLKALLIGIALGYFIVPRITGPVMGKIGELRSGEGS